MKSRTKLNIEIAVVAFFLGLIAAYFMVREPMEPLTSIRLQAARQQWRLSNIRDYNMQYTMLGSQYDVQVRDGIVTDLRLNGNKASPADLGSYSMTGLFKLLRMEIENMTDRAGPLTAQKDSIIVRVRFNNKYGYIERYLRSSGGYGKGASIQMIQFDSQPENNQP